MAVFPENPAMPKSNRSVEAPDLFDFGMAGFSGKTAIRRGCRDLTPVSFRRARQR